MSVGFNRQMALYRDRLIDQLQEAGFEIYDSFPLVYRPHVTLGYIPGAHGHGGGVEGYELFGPSGGWAFDSIEVWGLPKVVSIPLGVAPPPTPYVDVHRVANQHPSELTTDYKGLRSFVSKRIADKYLKNIEENLK